MESQLTLFDENIESKIQKAIEVLENLRYSVRIRGKGTHKTYVWTCKNHWSSLRIDECSNDDKELLLDRLTETTYSYGNRKNNL